MGKKSRRNKKNNGGQLCKGPAIGRSSTNSTNRHQQAPTPPTPPTPAICNETRTG